jgi:hypothetical protein
LSVEAKRWLSGMTAYSQLQLLDVKVEVSDFFPSAATYYKRFENGGTG